MCFYGFRFTCLFSIQLIECNFKWNSESNENQTKRNQDTKFVVSSFTQCNIHTRHVLSNRVL